MPWPTAVLFPGQGSQKPGMRDLVAAAAPDLLERCLDAPRRRPVRARRREHALRPARDLLASVAGWRRSASAAASPSPGHSLGELAALVAAGALDAARRAAARRPARPPDGRGRRAGGTMLALLGARRRRSASALAADHGVVVANDNAPGQIVLSGPTHALDARRRATRATWACARWSSASRAPSTPRRWRGAVAPFAAALDAVDVPRARGPGDLLRHRRADDRPAPRPGRRADAPGALDRDDARARRARRRRASSTPARAACSRSSSSRTLAGAPLHARASAGRAALDRTGEPAVRRAAARAPGIAGLGAALPARRRRQRRGRRAARASTTAWIERRTGIRARRRLAPGERAQRPGRRRRRGRARRRGRRGARRRPGPRRDVTADELTPNAAPLVAHALGSRAAAIDVGAACTGFLPASRWPPRRSRAGRADTVAASSAPRRCRASSTPTTAAPPALFGDGAGAVVLGAPARGALGPVVLRSAGEHARPIVADRDERASSAMEGHETFLVAAARRCAEATLDAFAAAGLDARRRRPVRLPPGQPPHPRRRRRAARARPARASSTRSPTSATRRRRACRSRWPHARDEGRLRRGDRVLLGAFGAGLRLRRGGADMGG